MVTHTDARIRKLWARGLTVEQIARKIGRPDARGQARVRRVVAPQGEVER